MGVPLERAWEICRILDEVDDDGHMDEEVARAVFLSDPRYKPAPISPPRPINPTTVARDRERRRKRLA